MRLKQSISIWIILLLFTACTFSYSGKYDIQSKMKTIQGVDYTLVNYMKLKNTTVLFDKDVQLNNRIVLTGLDETLEKTINKSAFEEQLGQQLKTLAIDSVSFNINDEKNKIDLLYYIKTEGRSSVVTVTLNKGMDGWNQK